MDKDTLEKAFIGLVEDYQQVIYKVCSIYADNREHLNDLYQEVVINLWNAYPRFRAECKASTWIYRIALNTCITFIRRSDRRPATVPITTDMGEAGEPADQTMLLAELYRLINRLAPLERALILLWLEEKSYQEIAEITGIKKAHVGVKLSRVKEKLLKMSNE